MTQALGPNQSHTPTPWRIKPCDYCVLVLDADGGLVADVGDRIDAARLMAAAPELLEALQELSEIVDQVRGLPDPDEPRCEDESDLCGNHWCRELGCIADKIKRSRAAINKATGKAVQP